MKDLVKGFIKWLIIVLATLIFLGMGVLAVKCQHTKQHTETIEQQDEIRFMFITVVDKQDDKVLYYRTGVKLMEVSFLFWDEQSVFKDPKASPPYKFKGCFAALTCYKHSYIYWLQRMPCNDNGGSFYFAEGK